MHFKDSPAFPELLRLYVAYMWHKYFVNVGIFEFAESGFLRHCGSQLKNYGFIFRNYLLWTIMIILHCWNKYFHYLFFTERNAKIAWTFLSSHLLWASENWIWPTKTISLSPLRRWLSLVWLDRLTSPHHSTLQNQLINAVIEHHRCSNTWNSFYDSNY